MEQPRDPEQSMVYWGPITSPEKRHHNLALPHSPSPLRRSPRLSSPAPNNDAAIHDFHEGLSRSRSATPDNDAWQDEPSSALASRISRANSNPSPPPELIDDPDSAPPTPQRHPTIPFPFGFNLNQSPLSRQASPFVPNPLGPSASVHGDLISFDSSAEILQPPYASTSVAPAVSETPSADELLGSWSPGHAGPPAAPSSPGGMESEDTAPDSEELVVAGLLLPDDSDVQMSDSSGPRTPLRRSTRPRRSMTPHLVPLPMSDDEASPGRSSPRTRRKGKERDVGVNENTNGLVPDDEAQRRKKADRKSTTTNGVFMGHRQLGSLSPGSANLLSTLVPALGPVPFGDQDESQRPYSFSVFSANPVPPATPPIRASPARHPRAGSPNRFELQAPTAEQLNESPARRIPVQEAVAQGQISPQRGAQMLSSNAEAGPSSKTPVFHVPPQDSPARRVHVMQLTPGQGKWQGIRFGSPTRSKSPERGAGSMRSKSPDRGDAPRGRSPVRGGSVEPRPPWNASTSNATRGVGSNTPGRVPLASPVKKGKLPFPLVPSGSTMSNASTTSSTLLEPPPVEPAPSVIKVQRSTLKQPTSRIPRVGQKPYARPPTKAAEAAVPKVSKLPVKKAEPLGKPTTSRIITIPRTVSSESAEAGPSNLKRKRPPSPQTKTRPVVLRQVPSTKVAPPPPKISPPLAPSPVKRPPVTKFRMVELTVSRPEPAQEDEVPASPVKRLPTKFRMVELHPPPSDREATKSPELFTDLTPGLPVPVSEPLRAPSPLPEADTLPPPSPSPSPAPPEVPEVAEESLRRTTRPRRTVAATPAPAPRRRTAAANGPIFPTSGPFAGMSAVALKALTTSNTNKNQQYLVAKLETEVVKREGDRPESPGMKVRTIAQKEADERGMKRKERAARRARKSDEMFDEMNDEDGMDVDEETDLDSSPVRRHARGPGDEEDYQTPKLNSKRLWSESMSGDEEMEEKKRVKWDRGLSTSVFLDEVEPRPYVRPQEGLVLKGCFPPRIKALRLDALGNHPQAAIPLDKLVEQHVVIKKFVYDNDEVEEEPVVPIKTRSKSKKKS